MKIQFKNRFLYLCLSIVTISSLFFSSCSTQKRKYLKGFYIEHIGKRQDNKADASKTTTEFKSSSINKHQASSDNKIVLVSEEKCLLMEATNACDTIIFTNGVKMLAKVISAGQETIIYKKCENNKDEFLNLESSKVKTIHYGNGTVIDLNAAVEEPADDYNKPYKPYNSAKNAEAEKGVKQLEKASFWFLLSRYIGFGFIVGFIFATCAKNNLKGKVGYESEFKSARFLHILGLVIIGIVLIPIIYILVMAYLI